MSRRGDSTRVYNVAVVGLTGSEKDRGQIGVGKSCLCNRFIRPKADDYFPEHISVLSVTDFSGRVVNNDHFLYWGYTTKVMEESPEIGFNVIEQTEFIDDATFQPFKGGKMEPYVKRCASTRIFSAEKLMYICKSQLGIEKEFEQKVLPDGRLNIDGFILVYDVSAVPGRAIEKQTEFSAVILYNLIRTKKPIVLVTTKNDEACEAYVKEAEKLVSRKEFRPVSIPIVETSAHENVNVDTAFLLLAQLIDKVKNRIRPLSYNETARNRKEMLDSVSDSFQALIQSHVTDHRAVWVPVCRELLKYPAFQRYIEYFGEDCAQRLFRRHLKRLKDDFLSRRERRYLERLPEIIESLFPEAISEGQPWEVVVQRIREHPDCSLYFAVAPSGLAPETDWTWGSESSSETNIRENRIPLDLLSMGEAETVWRNIVNSAQVDRKRGEYRLKFKLLLDNTPYVTPGKSLNELQVLFMGHDCFEALTGSEIQSIYEQHQIELIEKAKRAFIELMLEKRSCFLMLEHPDIFSGVHNASPMATITQQQVREMVEILQEDSRYKALDRLDQERRLMLLQHLGFVHCPLREHCPSYPNCMDCVVERLLQSSAPKVQHYNGSSNNMSTDAVLTLYLIGSNDLLDSIRFGLEQICEDDEYELDGVVYTVELNANETPTSFPVSTSGHLQARLVVYSTSQTLEDTKADLEKTLLTNLAEENIPFAEPPVVIMFNAANENAEEKEILSNHGQALADSLGCGFVDVSGTDGLPSTQLLAEALQALVRSLRERANPRQSPFGVQISLTGEPDIRVIMCLFCGDSYNVGNLIAPLFTLPACQQSGEKTISFLTFLGEKRRFVQILISSYHGASSHREDLIHGLVLVYSPNRVASFAALKAFSANVPNLPIQILAVTENAGGASAMFSSSLGQKLITEGNSLADELRAHFTTWSGEHTVGIYTQFFRQVWDQKSDIEKAFRMESPPFYRPPPSVAPRPTVPSIDSQLGSLNDSDDIYEQLQSDDSDIGSGEALVRPSMVRHRQALQQQGHSHKHGKLEPSHSDNFVLREAEFDNLWAGARRSHREMGSSGGLSGGPKSQQDAYLAFATGRRSHNSRPSNNNGTSTQLRHGHQPPMMGGLGGLNHKPGPGHPNPGRINIAEYSAVTDAISRMRLPRTSPPYTNLSNEDYVSDTGQRNRPGRPRRNAGRLPPPPSDSSSSASPVSDPEDFSRPRVKKRSLKNSSGRRHQAQAATAAAIPPKPKAIFTPIPTVPKGFVPYQLSGDSGVFSGISGPRNKSMGMDDASEASSPIEAEKGAFGRGKDDEKAEKPRKKDKAAKKLSKSRSSEQQQSQPPSAFGATLEEATAPNGILERCVRFIEEEGLEMEGLYRVPGNRAHVDTMFSRLAEDPNTDLRSLDIPVNAVATALKDFLAKRLPPPIPTDKMSEIERVALIPDRSLRLLELKQFLLHLPPVNQSVLRTIFAHLVRVSEKSRINAMDSKNLAICWWPTLLPFSFADMLRFEQMRPHLEDLVQTMIDQFPFLYCGKEDVVMV